jgi:hypothetical protein
MKAILFGLSLLACAAAATAANEPEAAGPYCVSFAPAGFCDGMQFNTGTSATWYNYDCGGSTSDQTQAKVLAKAALTLCDGTQGCEVAAGGGWDSLKWQFNRTASTGTLTGMTGGQKIVLQRNIPVEVTEGACAFNRIQGGISSLAR